MTAHFFRYLGQLLCYCLNYYDGMASARITASANCFQ